MAKTPGSERLFLAFDLPEPVREGIAAWRDALLAHETQRVRRVDAEQLHVTLVFLGRQEARSASGLAAAAFDCAERMAPPPVLRPAGIRAVPQRAPRLLALDLEDEGGRATDMQGCISSALESLGALKPEKRPFWPHVTLARVRQGTRFTLTTDEGASVNDDAPSGSFEPSALTLYRSTLRPQGALYEPLERMPLGGEKPSEGTPSL